MVVSDLPHPLVVTEEGGSAEGFYSVTSFPSISYSILPTSVLHFFMLHLLSNFY